MTETIDLDSDASVQEIHDFVKEVESTSDLHDLRQLGAILEDIALAEITRE